MAETKEELINRLHWGQVDFDTLADWYHDLLVENEQLRKDLQEEKNARSK